MNILSGLKEVYKTDLSRTEGAPRVFDQLVTQHQKNEYFLNRREKIMQNPNYPLDQRVDAAHEILAYYVLEGGIEVVCEDHISPELDERDLFNCLSEKDRTLFVMPERTKENAGKLVEVLEYLVNDLDGGGSFDLARIYANSPDSYLNECKYDGAASYVNPNKAKILVHRAADEGCKAAITLINDGGDFGRLTFYSAQADEPCLMPNQHGITDEEGSETTTEEEESETATELIKNSGKFGQLTLPDQPDESGSQPEPRSGLDTPISTSPPLSPVGVASCLTDPDTF